MQATNTFQAGLCPRCTAEYGVNDSSCRRCGYEVGKTSHEGLRVRASSLRLQEIEGRDSDVLAIGQRIPVYAESSPASDSALVCPRCDRPTQADEHFWGKMGREGLDACPHCGTQMQEVPVQRKAAAETYEEKSRTTPAHDLESLVRGEAVDGWQLMDTTIDPEQPDQLLAYFRRPLSPDQVRKLAARKAAQQKRRPVPARARSAKPRRRRKQRRYDSRPASPSRSAANRPVAATPRRKPNPNPTRNAKSKLQSNAENAGFFDARRKVSQHLEEASRQLSRTVSESLESVDVSEKARDSARRRQEDARKQSAALRTEIRRTKREARKARRLTKKVRRQQKIIMKLHGQHRGARPGFGPRYKHAGVRLSMTPMRPRSINGRAKRLLDRRLRNCMRYGGRVGSTAIRLGFELVVLIGLAALSLVFLPIVAVFSRAFGRQVAKQSRQFHYRTAR